MVFITSQALNTYFEMLKTGEIPTLRLFFIIYNRKLNIINSF